MSSPHFIKLRLLENEKEIASTFYWRSSAAYKGAKTMTEPSEKAIVSVRADGQVLDLQL